MAAKKPISRRVVITDFGNVVIDKCVERAYGVEQEPRSKDGRRKAVKEYRASLELLERNVNAIASHKWTMGESLEYLGIE